MLIYHVRNAVVCMSVWWGCECGCDESSHVHSELALITNKPRAASVYSVGPVTCAGEDCACFSILPLLYPCVCLLLPPPFPPFLLHFFCLALCFCLSVSLCRCFILLLFPPFFFKSTLLLSIFILLILKSTALDVGVFERLLGPCMDVMKRNFEHYEEQLMQLFGTTLDITDTR